MTYNLTVEETIEGLDRFKQWLLANYNTLENAVRFDIAFSVLNATRDELDTLNGLGGWADAVVPGVGEIRYFEMSRMFGPVRFYTLTKLGSADV